MSADFSEKLWSKTNDVKQKQCGLMGLILCHDCFSEKTVRKKVAPVVFLSSTFPSATSSAKGQGASNSITPQVVSWVSWVAPFPYGLGSSSMVVASTHTSPSTAELERPTVGGLSSRVLGIFRKICRTEM